jgi:hypothetical protein
LNTPSRVPATAGVDQQNIAQIELRFSVTTADALGKEAKSVGGFYTVQAASNPPDCTGNARARWLLHRSR